MDLRNAIRRARRALREDARLHLVAVSSLMVAFLCLGVALSAVGNLGRVADRVRESARMTIYLKEGASEAAVADLRASLAESHDVRAVEVVTSAEAREQLAATTPSGSTLAQLPADVFPASLEVQLAPGISRDRVDALALRLGRAEVVDDVETYRGFFTKLDALLAAGRTGAGALAILVLICVLAVVGNTIRLAVAGRRDEIEVLKLCGATDGYVRGPFLVEGAAQGLAASVLAAILLIVGWSLVRGTADSTLGALVGLRLELLSPLVLLALVFSGGVAGALGSALALRRYLVV